MATVATSPALTADFLLYGAFHAAHQAWHLLEDAVTLFRSKSYPTYLALSVFSLEEIGRGKFYLEQRDVVLGGQLVSVKTLASRRTRDHIWKLAQAEIPVTVGIASAGPPPAPNSLEEIAVGQRLLQLRKAMEESAPKRAHSQRLSALYVDVHPSGAGWLTRRKWSGGRKRMKSWGLPISRILCFGFGWRSRNRVWNWRGPRNTLVT